MKQPFEPPAHGAVGDDLLEYPPNSFAGRPLLEIPKRVPVEALFVPVERLEKELVLVSESRVQAPSLNPHGVGEIFDGGALKPSRPKDLDRAVQRLIPVELSGPSHERHFSRS